LAAALGDELATKDPDVKVTAKKLTDTAETITCAVPEETKRVAAFLQATPNGVQAMSADMPGLVQTSLNLGILNLLPIPALDGGRLVFLIWEAITHKPVPPEKEGMVHFIGLVFFMVLMVFLLFNDLVNIFG
jgi:Zn-dependent protease